MIGLFETYPIYIALSSGGINIYLYENVDYLFIGFHLYRIFYDSTPRVITTSHQRTQGTQEVSIWEEPHCELCGSDGVGKEAGVRELWSCGTKSHHAPQYETKESV